MSSLMQANRPLFVLNDEQITGKHNTTKKIFLKVTIDKQGAQFKKKKKIRHKYK